MENSLYSKFVVLITTSTVCLVAGYHFTCLNPLIPVINQLYNETYVSRNGVAIPSSYLELLRSLTFSMLLAGAFVGSLSANILLRLLGTRKRCLVCVHVTIIVGNLFISLICGLSGSYEAFIIGRFIVGCGMGCGFTLMSLVISETVVFKSQSFYNSMIGIMLPIGDFLGTVFGHPQVLSTKELWPLMISLAFIPSLTYIICSPWICDTPYEALRIHGDDSARSILRKLRRSYDKEKFDDLIEEELQKITQEQSGTSTEDSGEKKQNKYVSYREIFTNRVYRIQFIGVMALYGFDMLCGINNVFFYSDTILMQAGISADNVTYGTIVGMVMLILGSVTGLALVRRFSEKTVLLVMSVVMCMAIVLMTISLATVSHTPGTEYVSVIGVAIMLFGFGAGPNVACWPLAVAITVEPTRPNIILCGTATMWFCGWLVGFVAPYLTLSLGPYGLLVWVGCTILFMVYCWLFIPDIKRKTSDEIQKSLEKMSKRCDCS